MHVCMYSMCPLEVCAALGCHFGSPVVVSKQTLPESACAASGRWRPRKARPAEETRRWETSAASGCPDSPRGSNRTSLCSVVSLFRTYWSASIFLNLSACLGTSVSECTHRRLYLSLLSKTSTNRILVCGIVGVNFSSLPLNSSSLHLCAN